MNETRTFGPTGRGRSPRDESAIDGDAEARALAQSLPDRYQYLGPIGVGGMGSVHSVRDLNLLRVSAFKVMAPSMRHRADQVQRFLHEAQIMSQLDHPNIVPVHEIGVDRAGNHYFTMKRVQGRSLGDWISSVGQPGKHPQTLHQMLGAFLKVCDAVAFAHSRRVLHGDIKPDNVMVASFGQVYLMDWGLARWLGDPFLPYGGNVQVVGGAAAQVVGTPSFMAPEQARGDASIDERADIFGLGATLYNIVMGTPPYTAETIGETLQKARRGVVAFPAPTAGSAIPEELLATLKRALHVNPNERHASASDLKKEVEEAMKTEPTQAQTFAPGQAIVREGELGDCAYIILRGKCVASKSVDGRRQVVRQLGEGQVFGEMALLSDGRRTATVEAVDEVVVRVVTRQTLGRSLGLDTPYGAFVMALAERFRELDARQDRDACP